MQTPPPPAPKPVETPTLPERLKNLFTPEPKPEPVKPAPKTEPKPHQIQVNTQLVARTTPKNSPATSKPDNTRAIASAIKNLQNNLKPGVVVDVPGESDVEFRGEIFNIFNTPEFSQPNGSFGSSAFGSITSTVTDPRVVQFAIRLAR